MCVQVLGRAEDAPMQEPSCVVFRDLMLHGALLDSHGQLLTNSEKTAVGCKCWVAVYSERKEQVSKQTMSCPVLTNSVCRFTLPLVKELDSNSESIYFTCDYTT